MCAKKYQRTQQISFDSPSTKSCKKAARKHDSFCIVRYFLKKKRKPAKKIQRNVFLSICSSHVKNWANMSKNENQPKI